MSEFEFELLRRGATRTQITLRPDAAGIQHLDFELEIDPSQLSTCVRQIDAILAHSPPSVTTTYAPDQNITPA